MRAPIGIVRAAAAALVLTAAMPAGALEIRTAIVTPEVGTFCLATGIVHDGDFSPYGLAGTGITLKKILLSVPQAPVTVATGDADMGECAGFAVIAQAWAKGAHDIAVIFAASLKPVYVLVGGRRIKTLQDLKGGVIGSPGPQSTAEEAVDLIMRRGAAMEPGRDYKLVSTGTGIARMAALLAGKIDAIPTYAPVYYKLVDDGLNVVADEMQYVPSYASGFLYVHRTWAAQHRDAVVALLKTMVETSHWLVDPAKKDEVVARLASHVDLGGGSMGEANARRFYADIIAAGRVAPEGYANAAAYRAVLDIMAARGVMKQADFPPIDELVDYSYLNEARAQLGLSAVSLSGQ